MRSAIRPTENSLRARASPPAPSCGVSSARAIPRAKASAIVGWDEHAGLAVDDELRERADIRRDDGQAREHRLEHGEAEALPARRVHEQRRPAEPRADVGHAPEQEDAPLEPELPRQSLERRALGPFAEHDEHRVVRQGRQRADRDVDSLLLGQPRDREQHARVVRERRRAG